ncbi:hypothetical protein BDV18DRAFT_136601 [Aspergillus unguis]
MKFSAAATALFAGVALAAVRPGGESPAQPSSEPAQSFTTIEVTQYETYCPEATTLTHGSETIPVETPGVVTLSGGPYTITRPLLTSTITKCKSW